MTDEFSKNFILYKSRNEGNGSASQWNLSSNKDSVFLEMANQKGSDKNGNASFDWDNKIRFKLGSADIGEMLAVLVGLQDGVGPSELVNATEGGVVVSKRKHKGLYHSNPSGNAILYFGNDKGRFRIYLSVKRGDARTVVQHTITKGEACILSTLLRRAVEIMYKWN